MNLLSILKSKKPDDLRAFMDTQLLSKHTEEEIMAAGGRTNLMTSEMRTWEALIKRDEDPIPVLMKTPRSSQEVGLYYKSDGAEISNLYYLHGFYQVRLPKNYRINESGLYHDAPDGTETQIMPEALVPISFLTIAGGRYKTYFKVQTMFSDVPYVTTAEEMVFNKPKKTQDAWKTFLQQYILFNSMEPTRVEVKRYE